MIIAMNHCEYSELYSSNICMTTKSHVCIPILLGKIPNHMTSYRHLIRNPFLQVTASAGLFMIILSVESVLIL